MRRWQEPRSGAVGMVERARLAGCAIWLALVLTTGCNESVPEPTYGNPGDPLPGLTPEQLSRFEAGKALFHRQFTPEDGLGPVFNQARCSSCHDLPALGGTGAESIVKATRFDGGACDLLEAEGGDNIQQRVTSALVNLGFRYETPPPNANRVATVTSPSLFGLGLAEAVPIDVIAARADPDDSDRDGISGRLGTTVSGLPGRFGRKADFATIHDFVIGAFSAEMGLTTPQHLIEETLNGSTVPDSVDTVPDPEVSAEQVALVVDFVRFLVPQAPELPLSEAVRDTLRRGERVFVETGCPGCHVPTMQTGPSDNPAFDRKTVAMYSDFLLHDLGPDSRGVCGAGASDAEHRTARLMGLRHRVGWMHDGRATTLYDAIRMHGGEATAVREAFLRLTPEEQLFLVRFVASR